MLHAALEEEEEDAFHSLTLFPEAANKGGLLRDPVDRNLPDF